MPIKSFRGILGDGEKEVIRLSTQDGMTGYKIVKLQIMPKEPMAANAEMVMKVFSVDPPSTTATVDFTDPTLLGVAYMADSVSWGGNLPQENAIFDNMVVNQDIYVTFKLSTGAADCNYYIELEMIKLNANSQAVVTLKDIRKNTL